MMEQNFTSLEEYTRNAVRRRDNAQARLEELGDKATFADEMVVVCAQSQVDYLESLDDEPIPFGPRDGSEVSPHLLARLEKQKSNGNHNQVPEVATAK